jgi:hypothetical protein
MATSIFSNVKVYILNNHLGTFTYEKLIIVSENEAYLKLEQDIWAEGSGSVCPIDGSLSFYSDPLSEGLTDAEISKILL